jgi:hypothetical protein
VLKKVGGAFYRGCLACREDCVGVGIGCGHVVLCGVCARGVERCPECGKSVEDRFNIVCEGHV